MDLGRLPDLMDRLAGMATGISITPVLREGFAFSGDNVVFISGWEITFENMQGSMTVTGETIPEAVDLALGKLDAAA